MTLDPERAAYAKTLLAQLREDIGDADDRAIVHLRAATVRGFLTLSESVLDLYEKQGAEKQPDCSVCGKPWPCEHSAGATE